MTESVLFRSVGAKEGLVERVVNQIENQIVGGQLVHAAKLPPERELAEQLGVSRTVVREANRILVARGLLEIRHGVGTLVRSMSSEQVMAPISRLVRARTGSDITFEQLHQVRTILEVEIASFAAAQATDADLARLQQIFGDMKTYANESARLADLDAQFHRTLVEMTHNPLLAVLLDSIRDLLGEYISLVTPHLDALCDVLPPHEMILAAVQVRNPEQARQAMLVHQQQMRKNHEKYLANSQLAMVN
jgi:DNA-binding FadR family transcriptional regulator